MTHDDDIIIGTLTLTRAERDRRRGAVTHRDYRFRRIEGLTYLGASARGRLMADLAGCNGPAS